jgi:methyl-accepting chemotaxis protein
MVWKLSNPLQWFRKKRSQPRTKRRRRVRLFHKFALIFLLVVALPVGVIAFYASHQSRLIILDSIDLFIQDVTALMQEVMQEQQKAKEQVLENTRQDLMAMNQQALDHLYQDVMEQHRHLFESHLQSVLSASQTVLSGKLQQLNAEIAHEMTGMMRAFVAGSRAAVQALAADLASAPFPARREALLRDTVASYEQFVHVRFLDKHALNSALVTQDGAIYQDTDPAFTMTEPYLSVAFSGEAQMVDGVTKDGIPVVKFFIPVMKNDERLGVVFGVVTTLPLWNRLQTRFFQHDEYVYIYNADGRLLYPLYGVTDLPAVRNYFQTVNSSDDARGTLSLQDMLLAYATFTQLEWKIVVAQSVSVTGLGVASVEDMTATYTSQLDTQVRSSIEKELKVIAHDMTAYVEAKKQQTRASTADQHESFRQTIAERVTEDLHLVAVQVYNKMVRHLIPLIIGIGILASIVGIVVAGRIIKPIKDVTTVASNISQGNVNQEVPVMQSQDEIGSLSRSFEATTHYLRTMANGAQKISEGDFTEEIEPLSEQDALGVAFRDMTAYLREIAALATNISHGDLSQVVTPKSERDVLGNAIYRMTLYLQRIAHVARKVAGGNLAENSQPQSEKDFLGNAFAEMVVKLRHIVAQIRTDASQLVTMSQETQNRAQEEAESVDKISLSVEETSTSMTEMSMSIGEVNDNMQGLASFVGETTSSIEEMTSSIRQIALHSEQLAAASEDTSSSIQEISASLRQIADTAQYSSQLSDTARQDAMDGRNAVEKMIQSMKTIQHMVTVTVEAIQLLNKRTESIETILAVIKDISDQTSLLSINASIIAKKAGDRGRGFTVIADKVRKLADQSNSSAKEIAMIIRDVRKESAHAVEVASRGDEKVREGVRLAELAGKALDKIIAGANESSTVVARIAETTDEQTKISQNIMESMEEVVDMVNQIKSATREQERSSSFIMQQAEQILLSSQQVRQSTLEQTEVVKHVSVTMDDIRALIQLTSERAQESAQSASMLAQHAHALKQLVSQFTS